MFDDQESLQAIQLAEKIEERLVGNADEQGIIKQNPPSDVLFAGVLFPEAQSQSGINSDYRAKVYPNTASVQFRLKNALSSVDLKISFNVYFRKNLPSPNSINELLSVPDRITDQTIWDHWKQNQGVMPPQIAIPREGKRYPVYIRKRFCAHYSVDLKGDSIINLGELREFYERWTDLGGHPEWQGHVRVSIKPDNNISIVRIEITNQTPEKQQTEPAWFDIRIQVNLRENKIEAEASPVLDEEIKALVFTQNISLRKTIGSKYEFRSIALSLLERNEAAQDSKFTFQNVANEPVKVADEFVAWCKTQGCSETTYQALRSSLERMSKDANAQKALSMVSKTYEKAIGGAWFAHQLVTLLISIGQYLTPRKDLIPLVSNIPTAGGKTEAFLSAVLWAYAYESQRQCKTFSILKYPMTLLSQDQANRLGGYCMVFDEVTGLNSGFAYFVGKKGKYHKPEQVISRCPYPYPGKPRCNGNWKKSSPIYRGDSNLSPKVLECENGHKITISVGDACFHHVPAIVVSTWDKFIARADQIRLKSMVGGKLFFCEKDGYMPTGQCFSCKSDNLRPVDTKFSFLVLDEGHLIRGTAGTLDSHLESHYLELSKKLTGQYPIPIVATATIADAKHQMRHLGFDGGSPVIIPTSEDWVAFLKSTKKLKHAALAIVPFGKQLTWAIPEICSTFYDSLEHFGIKTIPNETKKQIKGPVPPYGPVMVYCSSYKNINHLQEMVKHHINEQRSAAAKRPLVEEELSRRRFDELGSVDDVRVTVQKGMCDIVYATNMASAGIDIEDLNAILFFGLPSNVSEFIQALNRTGRKKPAVCICVLEPNKERAISYYRFWEQFTKNPNSLIEPIPINRWAREAIYHTFYPLTFSALLMWAVLDRGVRLTKNYQLAKLFSADFSRDVLELLNKSLRCDADPSGKYPQILRELWEGFQRKVRAKPQEWLSKPFSESFKRSLRRVGKQIPVEPSLAIEAARQARAWALSIEGQSDEVQDVQDAEDETEEKEEANNER